jgi:YD repeat-containing protein
MYPYELSILVNGSAQKFQGMRPIINRSQSVFGAGWSLDGLDRLVDQSDGALLVMGNGDTLFFPKLGTHYGYAEGDISNSHLSRQGDGTYLMRNKLGTVSRFSSSGLITSRSDRNDNAYTYAYNGVNELVSVTDPYARVVSFGYTAGKVTSIQHYSGRVVALIHHATGGLSQYVLTDPDGTGALMAPTVDFQYSTNSLTRRNQVQDSTTFAFGPHGRLVEVTYPNTDKWKLKASETVGLPGTSTQGLLILDPSIAEITDGRGNVWMFETDRFGGITKSITPTFGNVRETRRDYNGQAYLFTEPDPDGPGLLASPVTSFGYNPRGDMSLIVAPDGGKTRLRYSTSFSQSILSIDPVGRTQRFIQDTRGNTISAIDGLGHETRLTYDSRGNLLTSTSPDPDGAGPQQKQVIGYVYDVFSRLTTVTNADASTQSYSYNTADQLVSVTDELGKSVVVAYDLLGRNTSSSNRIGAIQRTKFDALSRPVQMTDAIGNVTDVTYDTRERVSTISYPDPDGAGILPRPIDVMIYDKNSNLLRRRNPDSTFVGELRYKYDAENRLAGRSHSEYVFDNATTGEDLSTYETHEYDRIGRISKINRVGRDRPSSPLVLAEIGQTTPYVLYSYDSVGRVASEVHLSQAGEVLYQLTYTYSAAGELISRADGQGNVSRNVYDARGYKIQETNADPDGAGPQFPLVNRYAYDALGRLISMDRSFGRVTSVEYNSRNWPTKWTEPDPDGNGPLTSPVTQIGYNVRGDQTHTISPMGRITYFGYDDEQRQVYQVEPAARYGGSDETMGWESRPDECRGDDRLLAQAEQVRQRGEEMGITGQGSQGWVPDPCSALGGNSTSGFLHDARAWAWLADAAASSQ